MLLAPWPSSSPILFHRSTDPPHRTLIRTLERTDRTAPRPRLAEVLEAGVVSHRVLTGSAPVSTRSVAKQALPRGGTRAAPGLCDRRMRELGFGGGQGTGQGLSHDHQKLFTDCW